MSDETHSYNVEKIGSLEEEGRLGKDASFSKTALACIVFFIFGCSSLISWSVVITNVMFFQSKFVIREDLQRAFSPSICFFSMFPLILANILNFLYFHRLTKFVRVVGVHVGWLLCFVGLIFTIYIPTSEPVFFAIMMCFSFIMNFFNPIVISVFFVYAGSFPKVTVTWFLGGQALAGFIGSVIRFALIPFNLTDDKACMIHFSSAILLVFLSLVFFCIFTKTKFHDNFQCFDKVEEECDDCKSVGSQVKRFARVAMENWKDCLSIYLIFFATLFIYPNVALTVDSTNSGTWAESYFKVFHTHVIFNMFDVIGRYIPLLIPWPFPGSPWLVIMAILRFLFLLPYLMCYRPDSNIQHLTWLKTDFAPILIMALFAVTQGHMANIIFSAPYQLKNEQDQCALTYVLVFLLGLGLASGATSSFLVQFL